MSVNRKVTVPDGPPTTNSISRIEESVPERCAREGRRTPQTASWGTYGHTERYRRARP
jgi:hypothetical protein